MRRRFWVVLIVLLALVGCQKPLPTPTAMATASLLPTSTPTVVPVAISSSTVTSTAASTMAPTETPTTVPTATPQSTPTMAPTPTLQPTPTRAPTATPTPQATPTPATSDVVVNAADGLKVRAEANAASAVIRKLGYGTHLTAIGQPSPPDAQGIAWQSVRTEDGQLGWVAAQFVSSTQLAAVTATPATPSGTAVVAVAKAGSVYVAAPRGLNLRADKSADSPVVVLLAYGQRLETNGLGVGPDAKGNTWLNVRTDDGIVGWVAAQLVTDQAPPTATPTPPPAQMAGAVAEILRRTNELRQQNGLPPFALDDGLSRLALEHSQYMAQHGITHDGPGGVTAKQRIINAGYGGRPTENIYGGNASVDDAWKYWSTDPPHRANLLSPENTVVGIGVYPIGRLTYYTMDFAKPPG